MKKNTLWMAVGAVAVVVLAVVAWQVTRSGAPELEVRTYELSHLDPGEAGAIIDPYIFGGREEAPGYMSIADDRQALTVRETPDNLDEIARVLERFDRPEPNVKLQFRIIEADGPGTDGPGLQEIEELRKLFRYEGYTLVAEAVVRAIGRGDISQTVSGPGGPYHIQASLRDVQPSGDSGIVRMDVRLSTREGPVLITGVNVRTGQTLVLGSGHPELEERALILSVRAEIEEE